MIRVLCGLIDFIIVMLPVQLIIVGVMDIPFSQADLFFKLLFAVYGALFIEYMQGMSVGKYFGKIKVVDAVSGKPSLLYVGLRELTKVFYFIPVIGMLLGIISVAMMFHNGRALHDYVGRTKVIYIWQKESDLNGI